ncbi:unnamed protein product [Clonostachys chloroleuca]|uniref:Uncharacterized protein n=1 Tax=Clonostachys chloroleuca TaxID=1926264 RepID=A0AA35QFJ9_9HYPO|nr:unnamed protein product [Clonostachys chloroleuca]
MRFDIAIISALAATVQLTTASPEPAWNGKGAEAGYKFGAVACSAGALVCNSQGMTVGAYTLGSAAFCCSTAAASVTASQSEGWKKAWNAAANKLGSAAKVAKGGVAKVGTFAAECTSKVCRMVAGAKKPILPKRSLEVLRRRRNAKRALEAVRRRRNARRSLK